MERHILTVAKPLGAIATAVALAFPASAIAKVEGDELLQNPDVSRLFLGG